MAGQRLPLRPRFKGSPRPSTTSPQWQHISTRAVSTTNTPEPSNDVDPTSSHYTPTPSPTQIQSFKPVDRAKRRKTRLPASRYQFRPPRFYRGPLHPHQPPPPSAPSSRLFIPGPFSLPRLSQTYTSTLAPDLLTLFYKHYPPNQLPSPLNIQRLRSWDGSSPYHKNRPLRAPRGSATLGLLGKNITFRNLPTLRKIIVHTASKEAAGGSSEHLHVAGMVLQAITNVRGEIYEARKSIVQFGQRKGKAMSVKCELTGEDMWDFLGKVVETVLPRVKEWRGASGGSGDSNGNIGWGLTGEVVGGMEEVGVNYDMYPPKMIPGIDIICCTTATNDRDARLLLSALGVPFQGKHVNY